MFFKQIDPSFPPYLQYDHHRIIVEKDDKTLVLSPSELGSFLGITYFPQIAFLKSRDFLKIARKTARYRAKQWFELNQLWLGTYFQKEILSSELPPVRLRWIDEKVGWGVFAEQDLKPMTFVGEYSGLIRRQRRADSKNAYCFQYSIISGEPTVYTIDAFERGGIVRFINHSNKPNVKSALATDRYLTHVVLFTSRKILKGEQLCYDYGPTYWKKRSQPISF